MVVVLNAIGYQAVWLVAVASAACGLPAWGIGAAVVFVMVQWLASEHRIGDLLLLAVALAFGILLDGSLASTGWIAYASPGPSLVAPAWILAIWCAFALTFNHSLRFLQGRPRIAALLGLVGGPLAYLSAAGFGALTFAEPPDRSLLVLALAWAIALPLLAELALIWRTAFNAPSAQEFP